MERITKETEITVEVEKRITGYHIYVKGMGDLGHHLLEDAIVSIAEYGVREMSMTGEHIDHAISVLKKKKDDLRDVRYKEVLTG